MTKNKRQVMILDIIQKQSIETQEDLVGALKERGLDVTQATVSRDIKELRLVKVGNGQGKQKYSIAAVHKGITERQTRIFVDSVLSVDRAGNLIVIQTISGSANAAAQAVDELSLGGILGTIAGDNTILIIARDEEMANKALETFNQLLG